MQELKCKRRKLCFLIWYWVSVKVFSNNWYMHVAGTLHFPSMLNNLEFTAYLFNTWIKLHSFLQLDNTAEYYLKNPGILTHQDLLEEYGASGEVANNVLEDKGKIFQCYSLHCCLLLRSHMNLHPTNPFIVHKTMSAHSGLSSLVSSALILLEGSPPVPTWAHAIVLQNFRWMLSSKRLLWTHWWTFLYSMYGWAIRSGPCTTTFNDLCAFRHCKRWGESFTSKVTISTSKIVLLY
jgi:hypothetical protein